MRTGFQDLFHPPLGVLFTFPSRYCLRYRSLNVVSLGGWSPQLPTRFRVSRGTQDPDPHALAFLYGTLTHSGAVFQRLQVAWVCLLSVLQPRTGVYTPLRFGLIPVRSPLLRDSLLISLRRVNEMFQFTRFPPPCLCVQQGVSRHHSGGVASFGFSRLNACMQLPLNVSPVSASFIGVQRQGIHPVLCVACSSLTLSTIWFSVFDLRFCTQQN